MTEHQKKVRQFHEVFGGPIGNKPALGNSKNRVRLILEEAIELAAASGYNMEDLLHICAALALKVKYYPEGNLVEICDALADLEYLVNGGYVSLGVDGEPIFNEVHRSNMTKLGKDGRPVINEHGKILKGEGYEPPDIKGVLEKQGASLP